MPAMLTRALLTALPLVLLSGSAEAASYFTQVEDALGVTQPCGGGGCYTNYLVVVDLDNDDALDIIMPNSGFSDEPLVVYRNNGDATFANVSAAAVGGATGRVRVVAVADVTGDGFADFYAPSANGQADRFFINDGDGTFTDDAAARLPGVSSHAGAARFGDFDGDGDLDLLVGDSVQGGTPLGHLYLNDGSGQFTEAPPLPTMTQGSEPFDFDLFDMDGDFDLDVFVDMHNGKGVLWRNEGGTFADATASLPDQSGLKYGPGVCDVDGDGDLDIWQDNSGPNYTEQLMINDGTGSFTDETTSRVSGNTNGADDNGVVCIDADGDGDFDAAVTALGNPERLFMNDGSGHFTLESMAFPGPGDSSLWADYGDLNGDGKLDVVTGQGESGSFVDKVYVGSGAAVVDVTAPKIRAVEQPSGVGSAESPVVRFGVSDNAVTDTGPRLERAYVAISEPAPAEVDADFIGGDLFRAVLPMQADGAMVSFQVCAVDRRGNEGCSATVSYTVSGMGTGGSGGTENPSGGGSGAAGGGTPAGGNGADDDGSFDVDDGCGCSIIGAQQQGGLAALALALAALARRKPTDRRRR
jgi:hypothetical protein